MILPQPKTVCLVKSSHFWRTLSTLVRETCDQRRASLHALSKNSKTKCLKRSSKASPTPRSETNKNRRRASERGGGACAAREGREGEKVRLDSRRRLAALWRARRSGADREARGRAPREKSVRAGRLDDQRHPSETRPPDEAPRRRQRSKAAPPSRRTKLGATLGPCAFAPDAGRWRAVAHAPEELTSALAPARGIARPRE